MSIKKLSFMLLSALSLAALLNGCGSSSKEGTTNLGNVARIDEGGCRVCHASSLDPVTGTALLPEFLASAHNVDNGVLGCQGCHGGGAQHNGVGPIPFPNPLTSDRCIVCHTANGAAPTTHDLTPLFALAKASFAGNCASCHTTAANSSPHAAQATSATTLRKANDCIGCHDITGPQHGPTRVGDNNGVRAIVAEFTKWSHHVTGVNLQNAHCAACHMEGKVQAGAIVVDTAFHMADNKTHLRNADTDADMQWDPAAPSHTTMDNFCMSCHDANGATSPLSAGIRALMIPAVGKTASASNPFGDTISNRYDKMQRPAVVDASSQFNTSNNSHHAVKGKRYTGRTRVAGERTIASPATFANNSSALLQGERSTMFDAGNFNQLYIPLEDAAGEINVAGTLNGRTGSSNLGDDSTLHCGDCHTVGQWTAGSSTTALGRPTPAVIGAHGSNNEYMLRNSIGTDERHTQNAFTVAAGVVTYRNPNAAFLVCYNCHSYDKYGSAFTGNGTNPTSNGVGPHAGEYDTQGRCNGIGNTLPFNGYTTGAATDGTTRFASRLGVNMRLITATTVINGKTYNASTNPQNVALSTFAATPAFAPGFPLNFANAPGGVQAQTYTGEQETDFGNIFGIQCNNCHNSGVGNAYGGIHGSPNNTPSNDGTTIIQPAASVTGGAYIDGLGNTTKVQRFLPGLGNTKYVPGTLGGYVGGTVVPIGTVLGTVTTTFAFTTGGITNDTNWEQRYGDQLLGTVFPTAAGNLAGGAITGPVANAGAGCYTLGDAAAAGNNQRGPSVTGAGGAATAVLGTWGGCDDHTVATGEAGERQFKRIVRPVTY